MLDANPDFVMGQLIKFDTPLNLKNFSRQTLLDRYLLRHETTPEQAYARFATAFADNLAHAQRLVTYAAKQWFGPATPILSNAPERISWGSDNVDNFDARHFRAVNGPMPISCFVNKVPDSRRGIAAHYTETLWLNSNGGANGGCWDEVRESGASTSTGQVSGGVIPFIGVNDRLPLAVAQGSNRRGAYCGYLSVTHPEITEFVALRNAGGDGNRRSRNIHIAANIPDAFMEAALNEKPWDLVSPKTGDVTSTINPRSLFEELMVTAVEKKGEPFLHFSDTSNRGLPQTQKDKGRKIWGSNLCNEIYLATDDDRTAVCCLSSVNVDLEHEWGKDELFIEDLVRMLDNVLEYFIQNAKEGFEKAVFGASQERSIGLGSMGWHSMLQRKMIPYQSPAALGQTDRISKWLQQTAIKASERLAIERGEPVDMIGTGRRNAHLIAVAPTATNSIILNSVSAGRDPVYANQYSHKTLSGVFTVRNAHLEALLESKGKNTEEVWSRIGAAEGSVAKLGFLSETERQVFLTAHEIDMTWHIDHYILAQVWTCQGQSLNLYYLPTVSKEKVIIDHFKIWKGGLKGRYYIRTKSMERADGLMTLLVNEDVVDEMAREELWLLGCASCEG